MTREREEAIVNRGGFDAQDAPPRGASMTPTGEIPVRVEGHNWVAQIESGNPHGNVIPYMPGMTLRWVVRVRDATGPTVQFLGPATAAAALRELRHIVNAWLGSHPAEMKS